MAVVSFVFVRVRFRSSMSWDNKELQSLCPIQERKWLIWQLYIGCLGFVVNGFSEE